MVSRSSRPMDRATVVLRSLSRFDTDESVERLLVILTSPESGEPLSWCRNIWGKLSKIGKRRSEM